MDKLKEIFFKYKPIISYLFFGVCTTAINIIVYYLCAHILNFQTISSTIIAWIIAVIFAYIVNKLFVFECKSWEKKKVIKESLSFFACRVFTGVLDVSLMFIFVDVMELNDIIIKFASNVIVIVLNYLASKIIVFRKKA